MSADNWAICPRCLKRAPEGADKWEYQTFREDYEIWGAEEGFIEVNYSGTCRACGLHLDFEMPRIPLPMEAE